MGGRLDVTVAVLVYRSRRWLDFVLDGLSSAINETRYRLLIVANDPTPEVRTDSRVTIIHENPDPTEYYIRRVYRAWNRCIAEARTESVVLLNSDMYASDDWLDALVACREANPTAVPTSLLVESGRIPSALPSYVMDFGVTPDTFRADDWVRHADVVRGGLGEMREGGLFMPVLLTKEMIRRAGGYPEDQAERPGLLTGDRRFFMRLQQAGYQHVTAMGSVVYHAQEGEMRDG